MNAYSTWLNIFTPNVYLCSPESCENVEAIVSNNKRTSLRSSNNEKTLPNIKVQPYIEQNIFISYQLHTILTYSYHLVASQLGLFSVKTIPFCKLYGDGMHFRRSNAAFSNCSRSSGCAMLISS